MFRQFKLLRVSKLLILMVCLHTPAVFADQTSVQFDVVRVASALDVSTPEFLEANPDEKLIHIQLPISALVALDQEDSKLPVLVSNLRTCGI